MRFGVAFRVDANSRMGTGHFMRCLTLADALRQRGAQIRFVSRGLPAYLGDMLAPRGIEFAQLDSAAADAATGDLVHSSWLGTSQGQDVLDSAAALADRKWDWLVVDHYALDARWESAMRGSAGKIMVIDDLSDREHNCNVLLDQNYYRDMQARYHGKVPEQCRLLLGPRYALLRQEFRKLRAQVKRHSGQVRRILLFFGGVDADNYTGLAIDALSGLDIKGAEVDVVIGAQHPHRADIEQACATRGYACHVQTSRMAELMATADLAIGAGGSASWERCCLGVPALLVALAENQTDIAEALDSIGAGIFLGAKVVAGSTAIQNIVADLLDDHSQLEVISQRAFSLVDGLGVERVCEELGC